jgi:hypothetical protein
MIEQNHPVRMTPPLYTNVGNNFYGIKKVTHYAPNQYDN